MQESLALPVNVCYPGNGQKDIQGETRDASKSKAEMSSSPSLSPSLGDSIESSGSPLSSPKHTSSPQSPSGFMRNAKKRESKGKGKELKGTAEANLTSAIAKEFFFLLRLLISASLQRSSASLLLQNIRDGFQILGKYSSYQLIMCSKDPIFGFK